MGKALASVDQSGRRMVRLDRTLGIRLTALLSEMPEELSRVPNWEDMPEVGREVWALADGNRDD